MKHLVCKLKGHSYVKISAKLSPIKEYKCRNCKQKFTTDGYGRMVEMDPYWEANHEFFQQHFTD